MKYTFRCTYTRSNTMNSWHTYTEDCSPTYLRQLVNCSTSPWRCGYNNLRVSTGIALGALSFTRDRDVGCMLCSQNPPTPGRTWDVVPRGPESSSDRRLPVTASFPQTPAPGCPCGPLPARLPLESAWKTPRWLSQVAGSCVLMTGGRSLHLVPP